MAMACKQHDLWLGLGFKPVTRSFGHISTPPLTLLTTRRGSCSSFALSAAASSLLSVGFNRHKQNFFRRRGWINPLWQNLSAPTPESSYYFLLAAGVMASPVTSTLEGEEDAVKTASKDLLIIGPGVLGKLIAGLWMKEFPGCSVVGQTSTTNHHAELQSLGIMPLLKGSQSEQGFSFVVFCAPPSGSLDYAGELRLAAKQWNGRGVFLFTSSSSVYDCADNEECDEDTPIVKLGRSPRTDVLLHAEQEVLQVGGAVVRLAGLYTKERGPHAYWAKKGIVDARPDHLLNLIHYEDAASLCVTILKKGFHKEVFMGCDNHPLSRQEVMNAVNDSGKFKDKFEAFTGRDGPLGKKMNCKRTQSKTGWRPKYASFANFVHCVA